MAVPVDWNEKEERYNWELVFCELYAGGKYDNEDGDNYEYSLGLNGLGSCATQYACRIYGRRLSAGTARSTRLHFERGEIVGGLMQETPLKPPPYRLHASAGCRIWRCSPTSTSRRTTIRDVLKRQAVVNAGVTFRLRNEAAPGQV